MLVTKLVDSIMYRVIQCKKKRCLILFFLQDSKLVIDKYKSGFEMPGDIPFEDFSNGKTNSQNNLNHTPDSKGTIKGGTIGKRKDRTGKGIFDIFSKSKVRMNLNKQSCVCF